MEFRNHQVWVQQRLATFSGRPLATVFLVLVVIALIPILAALAVLGLGIAVIATLVRVLLGGGARAARSVPPPGGSSPTVIDVEVTRRETKPSDS